MNWETILEYLEETEHEYFVKCLDNIYDLQAHQVVHTSFKFSPSLTYLNLSCSELSRDWYAITSWENWRKYLDKERKAIIYNLDLEDKNQFTQCSPFCFKVGHPTQKVWTQDYEGFPGYVRYHGVHEPDEYYFCNFQTLHKDITEHLAKSNDKETLIRQWLPAVNLLKEWIGHEQTGFIYAFFLETMFEMETRNSLLIDTILVHSKSSTIWTKLDICLEAVLSTRERMQLFGSNSFFKGSCGLVLELLMNNDFSKIEMFIRYGLYPLNEDCFNLNENSEDYRESSYCSDFNCFFWMSIPRDFSKYVKTSDKFHLTNVDLLILIALRIRIKPKGEEMLTILWRCISNAFLTYQDFQHFFAPELLEEEKEKLKSIYLWYKDIVGADGTRSQPRNLKHYCRCVLRQKLRECAKLPNGIMDLPLPTSLKSYLRLEH